jgi:hypothetical protein
MKSYKIVGDVIAVINSVNTIKYLGVAFAALAVLFASAIPSYAWQPRTRVGAHIQARGGILSKIMAPRASCGASFSVATCGSTVAAPTTSCSGSMAAPSCSGSVASCAGSTVSYVGSAPAPVYVSSPKGSAEFAAKLAREGRMYHDRSYIGYENVASGASSPEDAVRMWQKSPPHRRNLPFITDIQCANGFCVGR